MTPDLTLFGTAEQPLRPSALGKLVHCPIQSVLMMGEPEDAGGVAAQTGSLVHLGVAAFHLEPDQRRKAQAGLAAMQDGLPRFPLADMTECNRFYSLYAADPRNIHAEMLAVERPVSLVLPPHSTDPTGAEIVVNGTLDQIRREEGKALVDDLKTGSPSGWAMIHDYAFQQAAYVLAARASGFPDAEPGRIIRAQGYRARGAQLPSPDGVFFALPWTVEDCRLLMDRVRLEVARIRSGEVNFGPGPQCSYCPLGGLQGCLPQAQERLGLTLSLPVVQSGL